MSEPLSAEELADAREFGTYERDTFVRLLATIDALQTENARLREQVSILEAGRCTSCMEPINPLHQQCACSRAEFEMLYHQLNETDTLRTQAEALAAAADLALRGRVINNWLTGGDTICLQCGQLPDSGQHDDGCWVAEMDAALRAYREATP